MRHECNLRGLPEVGGFSAHVRPGYDQQQILRAIHVKIVGNELAGLALFHDPFDNGMAAFLNQQFSVVRKFRTMVVALSGDAGKASEHVELRQHSRGLANARGMTAHLASNAHEQVALQRVAALVGVEDLYLQLFQLRGGKTFSVHQRLLAFVVRRRQMHVGPGDFNVIAEDVVEAHFERSDARSFALTLFKLGKNAFGVLPQIAQLIELGMKAGANHSAFTQQYGRFGMYRLLQEFVNIRQLIQLVMQPADAGRLEMLQISPQDG